ncbi:hypothetical protein JW979_00800, partial [bacterium]|nr:hypothetical protein [candidate division CSSED10-310 bacterium]
MKSHFRSLFTAASTAVALCFIVPFAGDTDNATDKGKNDTLKGYITGDFHTHTFLTDGAFPETTIVNKAINTYLLGWMANSEHGGAYATDPHGRLWDTISSKPFIRGDVTMSGGHRAMWRWQSLTEYSFPIINDLRDIYLNQYRKLLQSLEWNCPSHEHVSVGIMSDEPKSIGNFEYLFDQGDMDQSRNGEFDISSKSNITHADAVSALKWLQDNYS